MKDLTIEEKAQRYDEAINRIKRYNVDEYGCSRVKVADVFPEFEESEDERIRQNCIHFLELQKQHHAATFEIEECIAWLEKQGVSKSYWKPTEEQYEALTYAYNICSDTDRGNYYEGVLGTLIEDLHRLDEQHPKFKVGDIIKKRSTGDIVRISVVDLKNREYNLSNTGFIPFKYEHLWELVEIEQDKHDITI